MQKAQSLPVKVATELSDTSSESFKRYRMLKNTKRKKTQEDQNAEEIVQPESSNWKPVIIPTSDVNEPDTKFKFEFVEVPTENSEESRHEETPQVKEDELDKKSMASSLS